MGRNQSRNIEEARKQGLQNLGWVHSLSLEELRKRVNERSDPRAAKAKKT
jgi:hypothetical protein